MLNRPLGPLEEHFAKLTDPRVARTRVMVPTSAARYSRALTRSSSPPARPNGTRRELMIRTILASAAALALASSAPALACPNCNDCPTHKDKTAAADKADKNAADKKAACACADGKECKCGEHCECSHCSAKKDAKKDSGKKS